MTIAIVTDSSACVPPEVAAKYGISIVSLQLDVDGQARDANAVGIEELQALFDRGASLATSGPSPGAFLDVLEERLAEEGVDGALVITLAHTMSSTHQSAVLAASQAPGRVEVLDTGTAAGAHALVAIAAAQEADAGGSLDSCLSRARHVMQQVRLVAAVGSLDRLARSGRVPVAASRAGRALGLWPLLEFRNGRPRLLMPSLDEAKVRDRLVGRCLDSRPARDATLHCSALHAGHRDAAAALLDRLTAQVSTGTTIISEFDAVMMVHTGTHLLGLAWWWEGP